MVKRAAIRTGRIIKYILLPAITAILFWLMYYQLFYKARRVNSSIFKLSYVFRGHSGEVQSARFSPDGNIVATCGADSTVLLWMPETGNVLQRFKHPCRLTYLDYSPTGEYVATAAEDGVIRLWKLPGGTMARELRGHTERSWAVAFSPDGNFIASGSEDKAIRVWEVSSGRLVQTLTGHSLNIWSLQYSPDGSTIASGSFDNTLKFWSSQSGVQIRSINAHTEAIVAVRFNHSGSQLASGSDDTKIRLWNPVTGKLLKTLDESDEHVQALAYHPDDRWLISGGRDKPMAGELLQEFFGNSEYNKGVTMRLWDVTTGKLLQTFEQHSNDAADMDFSLDGNRIVCASADKTVSVWRRN